MVEPAASRTVDHSGSDRGGGRAGVDEDYDKIKICTSVSLDEGKDGLPMSRRLGETCVCFQAKNAKARPGVNCHGESKASEQETHRALKVVALMQPR